MQLGSVQRLSGRKTGELCWLRLSPPLHPNTQTNTRMHLYMHAMPRTSGAFRPWHSATQTRLRCFSLCGLTKRQVKKTESEWSRRRKGRGEMCFLLSAPAVKPHPSFIRRAHCVGCWWGRPPPRHWRGCAADIWPRAKTHTSTALSPVFFFFLPYTQASVSQFLLCPRSLLVTSPPS